jgi:hypothetical protein
MQSSSINKRSKRYSLKGVDNDLGFVFDTNKVVMRRNSAISLSQFYDHLSQQIGDGSFVGQHDLTDRGVSARRASLVAPSPALLEAYRQKRNQMRQSQHLTITEDDSDDDDADEDY